MHVCIRRWPAYVCIVAVVGLLMSACTHTPECCVRHEPCSGLGTEPAILGRAFGLWQAGGAGGQDGPRDEEGVGEEGCDTQQLDDEDVDGPV